MNEDRRKRVASRKSSTRRHGSGPGSSCTSSPPMISCKARPPFPAAASSRQRQLSPYPTSSPPRSSPSPAAREPTTGFVWASSGSGEGVSSSLRCCPTAARSSPCAMSTAPEPRRSAGSTRGRGLRLPPSPRQEGRARCCPAAQFFHACRKHTIKAGNLICSLKDRGDAMTARRMQTFRNSLLATRIRNWCFGEKPRRKHKQQRKT